MMRPALDQARGLRRMMRRAGVRVLPVFGTLERLPAIVNLASALSRAGQRVLVLDASRGEIAPAFGLCARYELKHVLEGEVVMSRAVLHTGDGVQVLPAARGIRLLREARVSGLDFFESLAQKAAPVDLIMVNCDSADHAVRLLPAHGEALLVLSRGPHVVAEAAACLKALAAQQAAARFRVLMMRCAFDEARRTVTALARLASDKFDTELVFGGNAPPHRSLWEAARVRRTLFDIDPAGAVARSFHNTAAGVADWDLAEVAPLREAPAAAQAARAVTNLH
jgi:MinD-like ATPase involved in chromosome partitioning or flagellar assembly